MPTWNRQLWRTASRLHAAYAAAPRAAMTLPCLKATGRNYNAWPNVCTLRWGGTGRQRPVERETLAAELEHSAINSEI